MMLPTPRVIAIDDHPKHLAGLTEGLNQCGTACSPIHFTSDLESMQIQPCHHVRVIFADLNLVPAQTSPAGNFSTIATLIEEKIKPSGPYFIVLWTISPEETADLHDFLKDRLDKVTKPLAVQALNKIKYLDNSTGDVKNPEALAEAIGGMITGQPQVAALFDWETRISDAAANTVSSILELVEAEEADRAEEIGRLLARLAVEAVGKEHVEEDRFRAVNDALLPILADRIAFMRSGEVDKSLWQRAFDISSTQQNLSPDKAAKLNRLLHIALPTADNTGVERGAVVRLPEEFAGNMFKPTFGLEQVTAATEQFRYKNPQNEQLCWVLVQSQAACDYVQIRPGPLPFHLGLLAAESRVAKNKKAPDALWTSPSFKIDENEPWFLCVSARFQYPLLATKAEQLRPLFRLREQLLSDMIYRIHSYGARPGFISFRGSQRSNKDPSAHKASKQQAGGNGSAGPNQ